MYVKYCAAVIFVASHIHGEEPEKHLFLLKSLFWAI